MIPAGELDTPIRLMKPIDKTNAYNERITTYEEADEVLSSREDRRGGKTLDAEQRIAERVTVFKIRYRSDLTERWKIIEDESWYEILHIAKVGRREELEVEAKAISIPEHYQEEQV